MDQEFSRENLLMTIHLSHRLLDLLVSSQDYTCEREIIKGSQDYKDKEEMEEEIVCKLWTQEPENFDEEVKSLGTAW